MSLISWMTISKSIQHSNQSFQATDFSSSSHIQTIMKDFNHLIFKSLYK